MKAIAISVVIITFNEERNIRRCLDSVAGIADELVVVDSFSTDHTAKICSEFEKICEMKGIRNKLFL
jgi:glycosyltransferase involved in cell wall biosynthesis